MKMKIINILIIKNILSKDDVSTLFVLIRRPIRNINCIKNLQKPLFMVIKQI